jgi:outer membrane protein assembly factor BamB
MVAAPILDGDTLYAFGYGARNRTPFSRMLDSNDKNKDGRITPDEYNGVNVLNAVGRYLGNKDGVITEEKWNIWLDHMGTNEPTGLFSFNLAGEKPTVGWRFEKGFESVVPTPLIHDGILYSVKNGGILTAFDAKTGEVTKTARIPGALGGYSSSPVLAAGNLYLANEEGKVSVIRPGREWELLQLNDLKEEIFATPALSAGRIYLRTGEALYCFASKP